MTYFETPNDFNAHVLGISVERYEAIQDSIVADLEELDALGRPDLDPEDRDLIAENDVLNPDEEFYRFGSDDPGRWA